MPIIRLLAKASSSIAKYLGSKTLRGSRPPGNSNTPASGNTGNVAGRSEKLVVNPGARTYSTFQPFIAVTSAVFPDKAPS